MANAEISLSQFGEEQQQVNGTLEGWAWLWLLLAGRSPNVNGYVQGDQLRLVQEGLVEESFPNGCRFKRDLSVAARVEQDRLLDGRIVHLARIISSQGCNATVTCEAVATFTATRIVATPDAGADERL